MVDCNDDANLTHEAALAVRKFKDQLFGLVPTALLQRAFKDEPEDLDELHGDRALVCGVCEEEYNYGENVVGLLDEDVDDIEEFVDGDNCPACGGTLDFEERTRYGWPVAHGRMYYVADNWLERKLLDDPAIATAAGFLVFYDPDGNLYLGIDGGGYSFDAAHWAPLYRTVYEQPLPGDRPSADAAGAEDK